MDDSVTAIAHDTLPDDLAPLLAQHDIGGTVLVQATDTVAETDFIMSLAKASSFVKGVVGWVDLIDPNAPTTLERLVQSHHFKGVRPMLQNIKDTNWILQPAVMANLAAIAERGLRLDALILPRHLDVTAQVAQALPNLPIVIDHCAKPVIASGADAGDEWREGMARLAACPNVFCKISGLANEAGTHWCVVGLQGVVDHVLAEFGATRLMWGSDWPVLNLVGSYATWRDASAQLLSGLSTSQQTAVYGQTAIEFYGLEIE